MFKSLSPGALGVAVESLEAGLRLASRHGFAGYHCGLPEVARLGVAAARACMDRTGVRLAACGLPVDFRGEEAAYRADLARLPELALLAEKLAVRRVSTWLMPGADEWTYEENFRRHVERLGPVAAILADHGIRLGLEYVAPKTARSRFRHPFVHRLEQMADLCAAVGANVGFLLDSWHWHCAGETVEALAQLSADQVVDVHVNDAPAGVPRDELVDTVRELPGETGVIDIGGFLGALQRLGYDGPVMVEPFCARLRQLDADAAVAAAATALDRVWRLAGG